MGGIYISNSHEEPLGWREKLWQPFLSCGILNDETEEGEDMGDQDEMETDWGTLIWTLSGMEFIRLSLVEPEVMESFGHDKIIISNGIAMG